ncbi:unnamed protein product [Nippostrongylus brasiliensis]|uniref:Secreted protein n=1 Tax=Nippostrongylus brasiliensis TaxID=27835 RepID=A0A0N4XL82_NIPBR|nr:unnamed protein product [Nippostrongylus brasiliensis]
MASMSKCCMLLHRFVHLLEASSESDSSKGSLNLHPIQIQTFWLFGFNQSTTYYCIRHAKVQRQGPSQNPPPVAVGFGSRSSFMCFGNYRMKCEVSSYMHYT